MIEFTVCARHEGCLHVLRPTNSAGWPERCDVFWEGIKVNHGDTFIDFNPHTCLCELFIFLYSYLAAYFKSLLKVTVMFFIPRLNEA